MGESNVGFSAGVFLAAAVVGLLFVSVSFLGRWFRQVEEQAGIGWPSEVLIWTCVTLFMTLVYVAPTTEFLRDLFAILAGLGLAIGLGWLLTDLVIRALNVSKKN